MNDLMKALKCIGSQQETGDCYMDNYNFKHQEGILNGTEKGMRCGEHKDAIQCPYHQDKYGVCFEDGDLCQWMDEVVAALEELEKYRALGDYETVAKKVEQSEPKQGIYREVKHEGHTWRRKENGEIDEFAWDYEYHNGPVCEVCGETPCIHCNPDWKEDTDCVESIYECPACGERTAGRVSLCKCGQRLKWGD